MSVTGRSGNDQRAGYPPGDPQRYSRPAQEVPYDRAGYDAAGEPSLGELFGSLTHDMSSLVRSELELAKVELKEEAGKAGKAAGMLTGGALAGYLAVTLLAFAAAWGLAEVIDAGFAFLVVGLVVGAVAAVLATQGRARMKTVNPVPEQTVATLEEDARWARAQVK